MRKIYFAGSIRGGRADVELYREIIAHLGNYGEVLTEHIGNKALNVLGEKVLDDVYIHDRDLGWILESDVMVAEVSSPSLGVGYEIGVSSGSEKPILCLYRPQEGKKLSAMIGGSPTVTVVTYETLDQAKKTIDDFFNNLS